MGNVKIFSLPLNFNLSEILISLVSCLDDWLSDFAGRTNRHQSSLSAWFPVIGDTNDLIQTGILDASKR